MSPILPEMSHLPVYQLVYSRPQPSVSESESQLQYLLDDMLEEYQQIFGFGKNFPADSFAKERKAGDAKTIITNYVVDNIQLDQPYAEGNSLTIADVNRHVTTAMEQLGFSAKDFLLIRPHTVVAEVIVDPKTGLALAPGYLGVFYYQQLDGVPILCHAATAFALPDMPQFSA